MYFRQRYKYTTVWFFLGHFSTNKCEFHHWEGAVYGNVVWVRLGVGVWVCKHVDVGVSLEEKKK